MTAHEPIDLELDEIFGAITLCLERRLNLPGLILLYSGLDIAGWLFAQPGQGTRDSFTAFVERYVLPDSGLLCAAIDLYAARCALLHTYTAQSGLSAAGKARTIGYAWGNAKNGDLQTSFERTGRSDIVAVRISDLFEAFRRGAQRFADEIANDPARRASIQEKRRKSYSGLSKELIEAFLQASGT
jgi:hypothetical protein